MRLAIAAAVACLIGGIGLAQNARASIRKPTHIPTQNLGTALQMLAGEHGIQLVYFSKSIDTLGTPGAVGELTLDEALGKLLSGSGFVYRYLDENTVTIVPLSSDTSASEPPASQHGVEMRPQGEGKTSSSPRYSELEEVIVTAQKREQRALDVPISITALSGEDLDRQGTKDVLSLARSVPGLNVIDRGPGERAYYLRGIGNQNGSSSLVGVYLDEMAITSDPLRQIDLPLIDLERVEVLRGPQGTLYGAGSAGGTIRFITRDPGLSKLSGSVQGTGFFTQGSEFAEDLTAVVDAPMVEDTLGMRLAAHYSHAGGWIDQPAAGRKNINDQDIGDVRLKTLWNVNDAFQLRAMVAVHRANIGWSNEANQDHDMRYAIYPDRTPPRRHDDYELYNLTASYDFGPVQLLSSTGYLDSDKFLPFSQGAGTATELVGVNPVDSRIFTQEIRFSSAAGGQLSWTAGAFYQDSKNRNPLYYDAFFAGELFQGINDPTAPESKSWAAFGQFSYPLTERLEAGAGVRYFKDDASEQITGQSATFTATSPQLFVTYAVTQNAKVYASAGKGFRSGGFNTADLPAYSPEKVISYELGLKMYAPSAQVSLDIAAFHMNYEDLLALSFDPRIAPGNVTFNAGEAEIKGVDASLIWQPAAGLRFGVGGNYTDPEISQVNVGRSAFRVGDRVDYVSEYNFALWAEREFNWTASFPGFARADFSRIGKMTVTNRFFNPNAIPKSSNPLDLLDLHVGARRNGWTYELFGMNLLNESGIQVPFGLAPFDQTQASRPRPRTFGIRVGVEFE